MHRTESQAEWERRWGDAGVLRNVKSLFENVWAEIAFGFINLGRGLNLYSAVEKHRRGPLQACIAWSCALRSMVLPRGGHGSGWVGLKIFNPTQPALCAGWEFNNPTQLVYFINPTQPAKNHTGWVGFTGWAGWCPPLVLPNGKMSGASNNTG